MKVVGAVIVRIHNPPIAHVPSRTEIVHDRYDDFPSDHRVNSKDLNKKITGGGANNKRHESVESKGDVEAVLQIAEAAAA